MARLLANKSVYLLLVVIAFNVFLAAGSEVHSEWVPLNIVDVRSMPWDERFRLGSKETSKGKLIYSNRSGAAFFYVHFAPGWTAENTERHYHDFVEWGYVLDGDFILYEFVSPKQEKGSRVDMRQGTWMYRPAFSIHGNRRDAMKRQRVTPGSTQLLFVEGGKNYALDPSSKMYSDDWKTVKKFTYPYFQHTVSPSIIEWENDDELPGVLVKWLHDEMVDGFRAKLRYAPPGWEYPNISEGFYYEYAQRFVYILNGDLKIQSVAEPNGSGETFTASDDFFVEQPPKSIWHWVSGPLTESGVMWLDITYANGTRSGQGPIEAPKLIKRHLPVRSK